MTDEVYEHPALTKLLARRAAKRPPSPADIAARRDIEKARAEAVIVRTAVNNHMPQLRHELKAIGYMIVPIEPSKEMVAASMATATKYVGYMPKEEKHRRRLQAALAAQAIKTGVTE